MPSQERTDRCRCGSTRTTRSQIGRPPQRSAWAFRVGADTARQAADTDLFNRPEPALASTSDASEDQAP